MANTVRDAELTRFGARKRPSCTRRPVIPEQFRSSSATPRSRARGATLAPTQNMLWSLRSARRSELKTYLRTFRNVRYAQFRQCHFDAGVTFAIGPLHKRVKRLNANPMIMSVV